MIALCDADEWAAPIAIAGLPADLCSWRQEGKCLLASNFSGCRCAQPILNAFDSLGLPKAPRLPWQLCLLKP